MRMWLKNKKGIQEDDTFFLNIEFGMPTSTTTKVLEAKKNTIIVCANFYNRF